jgi:hypothetical protein
MRSGLREIERPPAPPGAAPQSALQRTSFGWSAGQWHPAGSTQTSEVLAQSPEDSGGTYG